MPKILIKGISLNVLFTFDGSKSAVNHYFTPVSSSDLEECVDYEFFGTWTISFRIDEGISYTPMSFEVISKEFD